jgi:hypothetical protein
MITVSLAGGGPAGVRRVACQQAGSPAGSHDNAAVWLSAVQKIMLWTGMTSGALPARPCLARIGMSTFPNSSNVS